MPQPGTRRWLASSVFAIAFAGALSAQQLSKPPVIKGGSPSRTIQFKVAIEPEALVLRKEPLDDQHAITHVTLSPASGEPVFYTDQPGWPRLPLLPRFIALPAGAKVQSVAVTPGKTMTIGGVGLVGWASLAQPGQQKQPGDNPNEPKNRYEHPPIFMLDDNKQPVYFPAAPAPPDPGMFKVKAFPETLAIEHATQSHGTGLNVLRIDVSPVQWQVEKGELTFVTDFSVEVTIDGNLKFDRPKSPGEANMLDDLRGFVVNPGDLPPLILDPRPIDVPYLIITDDNFWTADFERTPGADLVEPFEALAEWKRRKGIQATVVRIADIVDGRYGDFRSGTRDLQETIRNFLKHAESRYRTEWVLLGGDVEVIPPRHVSVWGHVNAAHYYKIEDNEKPRLGYVYWDSARSRALINTPRTDAEFTHLISPRTGRSFTHAAHPTEAAPGWRDTDTGLCDMTDAPDGARCLELIAPAADIENTNIAFALYENTIPTDLYYASLRGAEYDTPGRHDWDLNNDGLYGTNLWDRSADGVSYWPTVRLGRAPVGNAEEAGRFVEKVRTYEQHQMDPGFAGKHLLAASNWGSPPSARRGLDNPPPIGRSVGTPEFAIAHFDGPPSSSADWRIVAWRNADSWMEVTYSRDAGPGIDGWYYCTDNTCTEPAGFFFPTGFFGPLQWIPFATPFIRVQAPFPFQDAAFYFFDHRTPDGAAAEKEEVKALFTRFFSGLDQRRRLYDDIYDIPAAPDLGELFESRVTEALTAGVNITSLSGHGWYGGCCGLDRNNVAGMNWFARAGVVYADSCLTNEFDQAAGDAVSELLLTQPGGGAVAYVGNTRLSWIGRGAAFERAFWRRMRTTRHIGALHNTKAPFTTHPNDQWTNFSLNLMGDPQMEIWRDEPRLMHFEGLGTEVLEGNRIRGRLVDQSTGAGVVLARVTLTGPGVYQTDITDGSGNFEFHPAGRPNDALTVTATHFVFEYKPASQVVRVRRRVFTLPAPPGLPPSWPPGPPRLP